MANSSNNSKTLYSSDNILKCNNINAYLSSGRNLIIKASPTSLSNLPYMGLGSMAKDGGNLLLSEDEKQNIVNSNIMASTFIKQLVGSQEFIRGEKKYCLWIEDSKINLARSIYEINTRLEKVANFRLQSSARSTQNFADRPHRFIQIGYQNKNFIFIPGVSSERREYIPMGFLSKEHVVVAPNFAIYDPETWVFGVISSKMHMAWVKTVAGRLKTDYRYSSTLCYNTFPFPNINEDQKKRIEMYVFDVLDEREKHPEKTLAELYDPDKMPHALREAHHNLDIAIEQCYRPKPFTSDEERLEHLFTLYEQMTKQEKSK